MAHQLTHSVNRAPATGPVTSFNPVIGWVRRANALVDRWLACRRSRRALKALTDDQLRDIGISRRVAMVEAVRPFWDCSRPQP
ncbi:MAG: DUF1127 domain-containing protein [Rhizobiaceae bacterium]